MESGYSSEEGEELRDLQFSFLKFLKTYFSKNSFTAFCYIIKIETKLHKSKIMGEG